MNSKDYGQECDRLVRYEIKEDGWRALAAVSIGEKYMILRREMDTDENGKRGTRTYKEPVKVSGVYPHFAALCARGRMECYRYYDLAAMKRSGALEATR